MPYMTSLCLTRYVIRRTFSIVLKHIVEYSRIFKTAAFVHKCIKVTLSLQYNFSRLHSSVLKLVLYLQVFQVDCTLYGKSFSFQSQKAS